MPIESLGLERLDEIMALRMETLEHVFGMQEAQMMPGLREQNAKVIRNLLREGRFTFLAAVQSGEVMGCCAVCYGTELPSPDNFSGDTAYIMNVYVREAFRHHGVATSLLEHLLKEIRQRQSGKIYLESTEQALSLYEREGFVPAEHYLIWKS